MIECIGHEQMTRAIHHDSKWVTQAGFEGRALVAPVVCDTNSGNALNTPSGSIPPPHQMIVRIGEEEIPLFIQCNPRWPRETAAGWFIRPLIPILTAVAHHSSYQTSDGINSTNSAIEAIGNEQRAV